jgi:hypothetical protein
MTEGYKREKVGRTLTRGSLFEKMTTCTIAHVVVEDENTCECHAPAFQLQIFQTKHRIERIREESEGGTEEDWGWDMFSSSRGGTTSYWTGTFPPGRSSGLQT